MLIKEKEDRWPNLIPPGVPTVFPLLLIAKLLLLLRVVVEEVPCAGPAVRGSLSPLRGIVRGGRGGHAPQSHGEGGGVQGLVQV